MADNGFITPGRGRRRPAQQPLELPAGTRTSSRREPYFFDYVQEQLIEKYGVNTVRARRAARSTRRSTRSCSRPARDAIDASYAIPTDPSSAIVAIDPRNGYIRAMASSGTYKDRNFNLAAQGHRQPGSTFKPFVLTTAILKGVDPEKTYYTSKPLDLDTPATGHWRSRPTAAPTAARST